MIYLDNAATTYPKPECVYKALDKANRELAFNAGRGSYPAASKVAEMIDETRRQVADLIHSQASKVSFESSATEALNIIINGLNLNRGDTVLVTPFEHNAIMRPLSRLKKDVGINILVIPFDSQTWELKTAEYQNMLALFRPKAVFVSHISNVTGYILDYGVIFAYAKMYNTINILDSSQSFGVLNPDPRDCDFIIFAGHKSLYASFGIAGFINVTGIRLAVTKSGGTGSDSLNMEMPIDGYQRYEAGSMNSVAVAGLSESLKWLKTENILQHEREITEYMINELGKIDHVKLYLPSDHKKVLGIVSLQIDGYSPDDVGEILADEFNICVRTGYHCAPLVHEFIGSKKQGGTVRASIGAFTSMQEIGDFRDVLNTL